METILFQGCNRWLVIAYKKIDTSRMTDNQVIKMAQEKNPKMDETLIIKKRLDGNWKFFQARGGLRQCSNKEPHSPHIHNGYPTQRYGWLDYICLGRDWPVYEYDRVNGDARTPDSIAVLFQLNKVKEKINVTRKNRIDHG